MKRKNTKKLTRTLLLVLIIVLAILLGTLLGLALADTLRPEPENTSNTTQPATTAPPLGSTADVPGDVGVEQPDIQQSQHLKLGSLYTSTIPNPDGGNVMAENIASLEVENTAQRYLVKAQLKAYMSDGTTIDFTVQELPAGAVAEIFDPENRALPAGVTCQRIDCISEEYIDPPQLPEGLWVEGDIVANAGQATLENIVVVYRCDLGEQFFGGIAYTYEIESLEPGQSLQIMNDELFGVVTVVRAYQ